MPLHWSTRFVLLARRGVGAITSLRFLVVK
jgi:hypothetical protein